MEGNRRICGLQWRWNYLYIILSPKDVKNFSISQFTTGFRGEKKKAACSHFESEEIDSKLNITKKKIKKKTVVNEQKLLSL